MSDKKYTTKLQVGLGLIEETRKIFDIWEPGMDASELQSAALEWGLFPSTSSRRLKNITHEGFSHRYLSDGDYPAIYLKKLLKNLRSPTINQLLLVYTCRGNLILGDFIRQVVWAKFAAGRDTIYREDADQFIADAIKHGKTTTAWSESTIRRVSSYLTGACIDFGLLNQVHSGEYELLPFRIRDKTVVYLAYDLHFLGIGDNALLSHPDWALFGLQRDDVLGEMKRMALKDWFIIQSAGTATMIAWRYKTRMEVVDALTA